MKIKIDNPIQNPKDDVLGRAKTAELFSEQILSLDASKGVVIGVLGPWGSGKTSFINLTRPHLEKAGITILNFSPWMFTGTEQLVESFFAELSTHFKDRDCSCFNELGKNLEDYGEILTRVKPLSVFGGVMLVASKRLRRGEEGISGCKAKIEKALATLDKPIVVVVDDIDRLTPSEIQVIFKLVRLTGNFPNIIYITEFDRKRVECALDSQGIPGRDYLEKILQLGIDLPEVSVQVLTRQILQSVNSVLAGIEEPVRFEEDRWADVYFDVIRPLIKTIRHVRRFTTAIHGTVRALSDQVDLVDILALEAVRMFLPDLFSKLHESMPALTTISDRTSSPHGEPSAITEQINNLIADAGEYNEVARKLISHVFPAAHQHIPNGSNYSNDWTETWLRERRVAHEDILRLYLERTPSGGLQAFVDAEQAWSYMTDVDAFNRYLRSLPIERVQDVIERLEIYEEQFTQEHVVPGSIVLLNFLPDLPDLRRGFFDLDPRHFVRRVVYRLLRSLNDRNAVRKAVETILHRIERFWSKRELILIVGYQKNTGHKLVSESAAREFERSWRDEIRSASIPSLAAEKSLLWTFYFARQWASFSEPAVEVPDFPSVTRAMLQSARKTTRSQGFGSRAVIKSYSLDWDGLISVYGSEDILRDRIESLKATQPKDLDQILAMADKYLGGWRPKNPR